MTWISSTACACCARSRSGRGLCCGSLIAGCLCHGPNGWSRATIPKATDTLLAASGAALPKFEQFGKSNVTAEQAREYAATRSAAGAHNVLERWWLEQRWLGQRRRRSWSARRRRKVVQAHRYVHSSLHNAFTVSRTAVVDLVATSDNEVVMVD